MQSIHLDASAGRGRGLKQMLTHLQRFVLSCICLENCRMCGKELSLAGELEEPQAPEEENLDSYGLPQGSSGRILKRRSRTASGADDAGTRTMPRRHKADRAAFEVSEECSPVSAPDAVSRGQSSIEPNIRSENLDSGNNLDSEPKSPIAYLADFALSAICVEAVRPALLKTSGCRTYFPRFSECLCHECWHVLKIDLPMIAFCPLNGDKQSTLPIASGSAYEGKLKDLISEFKYEGERLLAQDLACVMVNAWSSLCEYLPPGKLLIVPVPLHWQRKHTRGFNQSELLAKELATTVGAPVASRAITRVKSTKPQQKLGKTERLDNIRGAFAGNPSILKGKTVVLVDDVCTSGATLVECAEEALRCGASSVAALTIARAVLFSSAA